MADAERPSGDDDVREGSQSSSAEDESSRHPDDAMLDSSATRTVPAGMAKLHVRRGVSIGRYMILDGLGAGGMGVIYKAYDTELQRNVALKILRIAPGAKTSVANARSRLLREARALAQLSHPNVITVYDVGTFRGNVFVAMELVEGQTLREWLDAERRSLPRILEVFIAAARGLAAAHETGLIHRDFKPSNVMIGKDGRVRILDFGLARAADRDDSQISTEEEPSPPAGVPALERTADEVWHASVSTGVTDRRLGPHLTEAGAVVGTPAYMSPEQHLDRGITARSDQFAFCVTLYQALYGHKPFAGKSTAEIKSNVLKGRISPPPRSARVPRRLHQIVMRGLDIDPERRYPSMNELLADLGRDVGRRRRRIAMAALGFLLVGTTVLTPILVSRHRSQLCQGSEALLAAVWGDVVKRAMRTGFLATERAHAADTFQRVANLLDGYGQRWVSARVNACEATHERGEQSEKVLDLRMVCLSGKLHRMETLVQALAKQPDPSVVDDAIRATLALPSLESCADVAALSRAFPLPSGEAEKRAIKRVEALLDHVETRLDMGQGLQLLSAAEEARQRADATGYPPVQARAYLLLALVQELNDRYQAAEASLQAAARAAAQARDDEIKARAWIELINIIGHRQGRLDDAFTIIPFAEIAIVRASGDALLRARLARSLGWLYSTSGDYRQAQEHYRHALEILQNRYGPDSLEATSSRLALSATYGLATAYSSQAKYDQALAYYERIREVVETQFGPEHIYMVSVLGPMAENLSQRGELEAATARYRRALEIDRANGGQKNATMAALLASFASNLARQSELEEAQEMFEQALALRTDIFGPAHPNTADIMGETARVLIRRGAHDQARELLDRAGRIYEASLGAGHPRYATWLVLQGKLLAASGHQSAAVEHYQRAIAVMEAATGADHPTAAEAFTGLGELARSHGNDAQALSYFQRARAILETIYSKSDPRVGAAWLTTAETHLARKQHAEARSHFESALRILDEAPGGYTAPRARALVGLAESHLGTGDLAAALSLITQALELLEGSSSAHPQERRRHDQAALAWARFVLAQVLWETRGDQTRAIDMAGEARAMLTRPSDAQRAAAVDAWLQRVSR